MQVHRIRFGILVLILLSIVLFFPVHAEKELEIFNGWLESSNKSTTSIGNNISVFIWRGTNKVSVIIDDMKNIVDNETCKINSNFKMCYGGQREAGHDYEHDIEKLEAYVTVYALLAELQISNTFSEIMRVGENQRVTTRIENTGSWNASNISFLESFPLNYTVYDVVNCRQYKNNISWSGVLNPDSFHECSFSVMAHNPVTSGSSIIATYFDGNSAQGTSSTKSMTIADYALSFNDNLTGNRFKVGDIAILDINLSINTKLELERFSIILPSALEVMRDIRREIDPDLIMHDSKGYYWRGPMLAGEQKDFHLELLLKYSGNFTIKEEAKFRVNNIFKNISKELRLDVGIERLNISRVDGISSVMPEENSTLRFFVKNLGGFDFKNVKASLDGELLLGKHSFDLGDIGKMSHKEVKMDFTAPKRREWDSIINITLNYKSEYGQRLEDSFMIGTNSLTDQAEHEEDVGIVSNATGNDSSIVDETKNAAGASESIQEKEKEKQKESKSVNVRRESKVSPLTLVLIIFALIFAVVVYMNIKSKFFY